MPQPDACVTTLPAQEFFDRQPLVPISRFTVHEEHDGATPLAAPHTALRLADLFA